MESLLHNIAAVCLQCIVFYKYILAVIIVTSYYQQSSYHYSIYLCSYILYNNLLAVYPSVKIDQT